MTNATKAIIAGFINAGLGVAVAFGLPLTDTQQGAIAAFLNAGFLAYMALTYKDSPKRIPDNGFVFIPEVNREP